MATSQNSGTYGFPTGLKTEAPIPAATSSAAPSAKPKISVQPTGPQQHRFSQGTQADVVEYVKRKADGMRNMYNMRNRMQQIDRVYQRELDFTATQQRAKAANAAGDASKMQNVTIPVVMPQVESMLNYLSEVYCSSYPLFPIVSKPQMIDAALAMETVIGEQGIQFSWAAELTAAMRDGLKYNLMALEVDWQVKKTWTVISDATKSVKYGTPAPTSMEGNALKRRDPYNLILDTRVPAFEIHTRGEFAGYTEIISLIELKQRLSEMDSSVTMNAKEALESGECAVTSNASDGNYFVPQINPTALIDPSEQSGQTNWDKYAGIQTENGLSYSGMYEWTVLYARILPSAFRMTNISGPNTPQIFKFIVVNRKVTICIERMTNAHNYLPLVVAQCHEDGLTWQSKSFADNAAPFQQIASALFNSGIESQRRKVYDRIVYDPSRINKADIEKTSVVARIAVKSAAYGKPISEALYQVPYRDDNAPQIFSVSRDVIDMADVANGQNRVQRGQFQKGNKTRKEFDDTMNNSDSRPRMVALMLENRFFQPVKHMLKLNTLQYQPPGSLYNRNTKAMVEIDPSKLRATAMEFQVADGMMPSEKLVNMETFQGFLNMAQANPQIGLEYDIGGITAYWFKLQGATWLNDFKRTPTQQAQTVDATQPTPGMDPQVIAAAAQQAQQVPQ